MKPQVKYLGMIVDNKLLCRNVAGKSWPAIPPIIKIDVHNVEKRHCHL